MRSPYFIQIRPLNEPLWRTVGEAATIPLAKDDVLGAEGVLRLGQGELVPLDVIRENPRRRRGRW